MRRSILAFSLGLATLGAACGSDGKTDGGTVPGQDLSGTSGGKADMIGGPTADMTGTPPADMTGPAGPDLVGVKNTLDVFWRLENKNIQGAPQNHFPVGCHDAMYPTDALVFTATNPATGASVATTAPCPAMDMNGEIVIPLPDGTPGPFRVSATAKGQSSSVSELVSCVKPNTSITVRVYLGGCDDPACTTPKPTCN